MHEICKTMQKNCGYWMIVTNIYINPGLNNKVIHIYNRTQEQTLGCTKLRMRIKMLGCTKLRTRIKMLGCTKLRTRIKMQDGIMPNENNRGRNSNFLHNPRWFEVPSISYVFDCIYMFTFWSTYVMKYLKEPYTKLT
jgi:hypothetical protein